VGVPRRLQQESGKFALVDGIPFELPIRSQRASALMAGFAIDAGRARELLPGLDLQPVRLWRRGLLLITVVDYQETVIGSYIEFSIAIACTRGRRPAPPLLPLLFRRACRMGQYVYDLPVSTEISVKGGKGIWGMPKHQASLDFQVGERMVSSQYDLDGRLAMRIEIERLRHTWLPLRSSATNYSWFRGMIMKSDIYFKGGGGFLLFKKGSARLCIGDHPRLEALKGLDIDPDPVYVGFFPSLTGLLDDHVESWFSACASPPVTPSLASPGVPGDGEDMRSVVDLGLGRTWPPPPRPAPDCHEVR
jgi:hypothetical protein